MIPQILSTVTAFGSASIDTSPPTVDLTTEKEKQSQIMAAIQQPTPKSISDIIITLNSTLNISKGKYSNIIAGCTICPNGKKVVFADCNNGRLVIFNDNGTVDKAISSCAAYCGPHDVISIDDSTIALSTNSGIQIIHTESYRTKRTIKTSGECYGITHHEGVLLWCEISKGIQMLQLTDKSVTTVVKQDTLGNWSYITTSADKIYQTDYYNDTVTCFTRNGDKLWEYKDKSVIKTPCGVAVDNNYSVYISSYGTNSVVVLSPDGQRSRKLLGEEHGLEQPGALHYDIRQNKLIVCNASGCAFLYDISY